VEEIASRLTSILGLGLPPIALRFVEQPPAGAEVVTSGFPSSCSFWRAAESRTFYAPAVAHHGCVVGTMVMGFPVDAVHDQLGSVVATMADAGYLSSEEAASIPTVPKPSSGIVYGPLAGTTETPDVVLVWANAKQLMLLGEAAGSAAWTTDPTKVTGRPGCATLPRAMNSGGPAMSVGCIGMRTFTGVPDDLMLVAIPGSALSGYVDDLERLRTANDRMQDIYEGMLNSAGSAT
jgi:uncharacterized protein (DUF169 family)